MKKTIKKYILVLLICSFAYANEGVLIKKWFSNRHTFIIVCKGYPKKDLSGKARIESAKEAALINAQVLAKNIFNKSVDVIKKGTILKYKMYQEYAVIYYAIKKKNLKNYLAR